MSPGDGQCLETKNLFPLPHSDTGTERLDVSVHMGVSLYNK